MFARTRFAALRRITRFLKCHWLLRGLLLLIIPMLMFVQGLFVVASIGGALLGLGLQAGFVVVMLVGVGLALSLSGYFALKLGIGSGCFLCGATTWIYGLQTREIQPLFGGDVDATTYFGMFIPFALAVSLGVHWNCWIYLLRLTVKARYKVTR